MSIVAALIASQKGYSRGNESIHSLKGKHLLEMTSRTKASSTEEESLTRRLEERKPITQEPDLTIVEVSDDAWPGACKGGCESDGDCQV